ncbi:LADA_0C07932g1_1 [Lachancea dasiensis]|uniref:Histone H1 n=1 Tax=Lachancea dasiensis TaxID=1072105 RepID=A0A1G4J047_9SACH|nr:LADA_0C07932g1_1 [Lachancea dasiensis]
MPTRVTSKVSKNSSSSAQAVSKPKAAKVLNAKPPNKKNTKPSAAAAAAIKPKASLPTYKEMIMDGISSFSDRNGTSRQALKKHILGKYAVGDGFENHLNLAIRRGIEAGEFSQPKGPSGPLKLVKKNVSGKSELNADKEEPIKRRRESASKKKPKVEDEKPKLKEGRRSSGSGKASSAGRVAKKPATTAKKSQATKPLPKSVNKTAAKPLAKPVTRVMRSTAKTIAA